MSTRTSNSPTYTPETQSQTSITPMRGALAHRGEELRNRIRRLFQPQLSPFSMFDEPMFENFFNQPLSLFPMMDVAETNEEFLVTAELPGMKRNDIHVEFDNGMLTIRGEKTDERKEGDGERRYHLWERSYGSFNRTLTLPAEVEGTKIVAEFADGILTVHVPKSADAKTRHREIEILEKK